MPEPANPLISIIVPVFNVAAYLERCVKSIICQNYQNIEIILVDDGSTDESGRLCDVFSRKDQRINVIHQTNGGLSSARNAGLDVMKGEYIGFVDGDDFIDRDMYGTLIKAALDHDADIVQTGFRHTDENGNVKDEITFRETCYDQLDDMFRARFKENNIHVGVWTKLYKRKIFEKIRFREGYVYEDYAILPMILNACRKFVVIGGAFYNYAANPRGISSTPADVTIIRSRLDMPLYVLESIEAISPEYVAYAYQYICESSIKGYCKISETDRMDKETGKDYSEKLTAQFKKYYERFKKDKSFGRQKFSRKVKLYIFSKRPYMACKMTKFVAFARRVRKNVFPSIRR